MTINSDIASLELKLLLQAIELRYGYHFTEYAQASLSRRVQKHLATTDLNHISELIPRFIHDERAFAAFVQHMSVVVTEMFRDPEFFHALRDHIVPTLKTYPFIKIWHAGCATGQEAYSMAIIMEEEGLLERCQIYATDFNDHALTQAKTGIYPQSDFDLYSQNYRNAGGKRTLSDYCHQGYDSMKFSQRLLKHITFANHNLVTDGVFGDMNLVLCRNVLIYFNESLQNRVLELLMSSLRSRGTLCLGNRESIRFSSVRDKLSAVDSKQRIYRKNH